MHIEFKNVSTGKYYYLTGADGDYAGIIWTPDIQNKLTHLSLAMTVGELCDMVRPVVDRLMSDNNDRWEMVVFYYKEGPIHSLTESGVSVLASYEVGDVIIIDGVRQKTLFHPKY